MNGFRSPGQGSKDGFEEILDRETNNIFGVEKTKIEMVTCAL